MKLLIEATFFNFKYITGIERHFFLQLEILEKTRLFEEIFLVVKNDIPKKLLNYDLELKIIKISDNSVETWKRIYENCNPDLVYATFVPPPILPQKQIPVIYVLHDPGRYIYPELMEKGALDEHMRLFEKYVKLKQFYVITVSKSSKKDILKYFPILAGHIFVVYPYISKTLKQIKSQNSFKHNFSAIPRDKFFLTIGRFMPTKNTLNIVKAFKERADVFKDFKLIIIGRNGWYKELDDFLEHNKSDDIAVFDYIKDEDLVFLYKNCYGFISASIYEGFGLPLIEARFYDCERIFCSDIPVYREINLDNAVYFDPFNYSDLRDKIFNNLIPRSISSNTQLKQFLIDTVADDFKMVVLNIVKLL